MQEFNDSELERNKIISQLSMSKQFALRQLLKQAESLNREQAIEMLKESLVNSAYKDYTFLTMMLGDSSKT